MANVEKILMALLAMVVSLAIGGAFVAGTFLNVVILNFLPLIVHQIVGWVVIVGAIWGFISFLMKKK